MGETNDDENEKQLINYFGHSFLDRCSDKRRDSEWIESHLRSSRACFVLFHGDKPLVKIDPSENGPNAYSLYKFARSQLDEFLAEPTPTDLEQLPNRQQKTKCIYIFLGLEYDCQKDVPQSIPNTNNFETNHSAYSNESTYKRKPGMERPWFAIDTSGYDADIEIVEKKLGLDKEGDKAKFFDATFIRSRPDFCIADSRESSVIAQARAILCWFDRNAFCASCGQRQQIEDAGNKLTCKNAACKSKNRALNKMVPSNIHYPRVDPVVIMLVIHPAKTHVLLGRKKQFPKNMFSCLAGYVEAGESIEDAVRRETFEESGIYSDRVVYNSSQPWPFPSSLMMGVMSYATSDKICTDNDEIEEARWFSFDEIDLILEKKHPEGIFIPGQRAIANQLIAHASRNKSKL